MLGQRFSYLETRFFACKGLNSGHLQVSGGVHRLRSAVPCVRAHQLWYCEFLTIQPALWLRFNSLATAFRFAPEVLPSWLSNAATQCLSLRVRIANFTLSVDHFWPLPQPPTSTLLFALIVFRLILQTTLDHPLVE